MDDQLLIHDLKALKANNKNTESIDIQDSKDESVTLDYEEIIKDFEENTYGDSGWGETEIDIITYNENYPISNLKNAKYLKRLLNNIYRVIIE